MGTFLTLGMLVAICGFIAYSGDLLGRRLGKRRLTLWGLRPRHTAIVSTVVTGMGIAVLTLGALFGLSAGVRRAVLHGEGLLVENYRLIQANRNLVKLNNAQLGYSDELKKRTEDQSLQIRAQGEVNRRLQSEKTTLDQKLVQVRTQVAALQKERAELEYRLASLERDRRQILAQNRSLRGETADTRRRLVGTRLQYTKAREGLQLAQRNLQTTQTHLAKVQRSLRLSVDQAQEERERREALARQRLLARKNEELARIVLPPGSPKPAIRELIEGLVRRAETAVAARGPAVKAGSAPRVALYPTWIAPSDVVSMYVNDVRAEQAGRLPGPPVSERGYTEGMVLRAVAVENAVPGRPVPVLLKWSMNRLAFRKGEEIASLTLSGRQSEGELLRALLGFLQTQVREKALDRGVLPSADGRVGEIQYDPLLITIRKIQEIDGAARVGVIANDDVWSAGPVPIDFYVLPAETRVADDTRR
jgi:uncharacterized protein (DUF3084 family)